jgi:hypothetical protein
MKKVVLLALFLMLLSFSAGAEYRAYYVEIYDHILKTKWDLSTGFSPDKYITTHGGGNRLSAHVKATWQCFGDTSGFKKVCPMPKPIQPEFQVGELVKVKLDKHPAEGWSGQIELAYYQASINSNVYGVRFDSKRNLYMRLFEFDLKKTDSIAP